MEKIQAEIFDIKDNFITLKVDTFFKLEVGKKYNIDFKQYHTVRSLQQNSMMWAIIQRIAKETLNDEFEIYVEGLEKANCASEFLLILPEALESIKKTFRAVKVCENRLYNGKQMLVVKCYIGSSKYDSKEMTDLINYFVQLASELNIYIGDIK